MKLYESSAGSGKTYILAVEYIKCLLMSDVSNYFQFILTMSFTKDSTREIKERILAELYGLARNTPDSVAFLASLKVLWQEEKNQWQENLIRKKSEQILHSIIYHYNRLNIVTIDSFFQRILRNLTHELVKGNHFNLELNTNEVLQVAIHQVIQKAIYNKQVFQWLIMYAEYLIKERKPFTMEEYIETFGKCIYNESFQRYKKNLPNNFEYFDQLLKQQQNIQKQSKKIFEITNKKVLDYLEEYQLDKTDFIRGGFPINFFQRIINENYPNINLTIKKCSINENAWSRQNHKKKGKIIFLAKNTLIPLLNIVLNEVKKNNTAKMIESNIYQLGLIGEIIKEVEKENSKRNRFLLSDMNIFIHQMIDESDSPFIYEKIGGQIKHVMIDEFQDTSKLQWQNFRTLLQEIISQNTLNLIVGDEKQSIYRWRNSDWKIINKLSTELNTKKNRLSYNWRSEKCIIEFNNSFFVLASKLIQNQFSPSFSDFFLAYEENKIKQKTNKSDFKGYVSIQLINNNEANKVNAQQGMFHSVLTQVLDLYKKNIPAKNICLLVRKNETINLIADFFSHKKNDYPELLKNHYLTLISDEIFQLKNSLVIKIIISSFKVIAYPDNKFYQEQLRIWIKTAQLSCNIQEEIKNPLLLSIPLFRLIQYLYQKLKLEQIVGQSAYIYAFYDCVIEYLKKYPATIHHFIKYWEKEYKTKTISTGIEIEGIRTMTIHKSKGLQFHTVIIPCCDWLFSPEKPPLLWCKEQENKNKSNHFPLFPIIYKKEMKQTIFATDYEVETVQSYVDNLNLLYVAFTRAEKNLIILSKKENGNNSKIKRVSNLLQLTIHKLEGNWNEKTGVFKIGEIFVETDTKKYYSDNPLKQIPIIQEIQFSPVNSYFNQWTFKKSNGFNQLIRNKQQSTNDWNVMQEIFLQIEKLEDIEKVIEKTIAKGVLSIEDKKHYMYKIHDIINHSNVNDWFSDSYKVYNEYSILTKKQGVVISKRPDRILISKKKLIVIDYKFGNPQIGHKKQLKEYVHLLHSIDNNLKIEGYLWYVGEKKIESI